MNETKTNEKTKVFSKGNAKKAVSLLLVFSLLMGAMYAFLTSKDVKVNTFTLGNIDITLHEDNWDEYYENHPEADRETDAPDFAQNILPNQSVEKAPYVTNDTETNDAWVYITVATPTEPITNLVADSEGNIAIEGTAKQIKVYAYGIQPNYTSETTETAEGVWAKYVSGDETTDIDNLDYTSMYGAATTDTSERYQIFQTLVGSKDTGYELGVNTTNWTKIGQKWTTDDGYVYTVYKYNTKLEKNGQTEPIFDAVKLIGAIGEAQDVVLRYYAPVTSNASGKGVGAAKDDTQLPAPEIPGYELISETYFAPGDSIGQLEDTTKYKKELQYEEWVDMNNPDKKIYSGMKITEPTNLILQYSEIEYDQLVPEKYFVFSSQNTFAGLHISFFEEMDTSKAYTLVVPKYCYPQSSSETVQIQSSYSKASSYYKTSTGYYTAYSTGVTPPSYYNGVTPMDITSAYVQIKGLPSEIKSAAEEQSNGVYNLDTSCIKQVVFEKEYNTAAIYMDSSVTTYSISSDLSSLRLNGDLEKVYFSYGTKNIPGMDLAHVSSLVIPGTVTGFGGLKGSLVSELTIPASVTSSITVGAGLDGYAPIAVSKNANLTTLHVDGSCDGQSPNASYCPNLSTVYFSNGIVQISSECFVSTPSITTIYYEGSMAQWNTIAGVKYVTAFANATVHCSDGDLVWGGKAGNSYKPV